MIALYSKAVVHCTERKAMASESPRADASAWCRPLFEGTRLSMLVCDPVSQEILDVNDAVVHLLGYPRAHLLGMRLPDLYLRPGRERAGVLRPETCRLHARVRRVGGAGGEVHHAILQRAAIEYGGRDAVLVVLQDVTRHVEAEIQLRDTQNELHRAQSLALIGNWIWDAASDPHVASSPEGYRIMGFRPEDTPVTTAEIHARIHPDDRAMAERARERALHDPDYKYDIEFRLVRPDGEVRWLHSVAEVRRDAGGRAVKMLGLVQDVTERRRAEDDVRRLAYYDTVTGLPNMNLFESEVEDRLAQLRRGAGRGRSPARLACLIVDLVRFRDVNYALTHMYGDVLLALVADRLAAVVGAAGVVARCDARFPVVLDGADEEEARRWAQHLLRALEAPFSVAGISYEIGARIGIAFAPLQGLDYHTLLRKADIALYQAAGMARNVAVYAAEDDPHTPDRLALIGDFRAAIEAGQIQLFCQPKVTMDGREIVGAEALVRWVHPDKGCIGPEIFMPLIEATDLIHVLTRHMLESSVAQCEAWRAQGVRLPIAVNLSARDIAALSLSEHLRELLEQHGSCAGLIGLEMTESSLMQNPAESIAELERLSGMGFRLYIDDFGTGYSSLSYLSRLPVDVIKIDHGFTMQMIDDGRAASIVKSTVHLAHDLGMSVVAEGVSNARIWEALQALGCDEAQGFHVAAPMPAGQLLDWARASPYRLPDERVCA
jgi:diguanylate cyclase (GGDEF)-like protein/PAS domain S-box-containing protein